MTGKNSKDTLEDILGDPNEAIRTKRMQTYLSNNKLEVAKDIVMTSRGTIIEVVLNLVGLGGATQLVRLVFRNQQTLMHVYSVVKCFFLGQGDSGVLLALGAKMVFPNLHSQLSTLVGVGSVTVKAIRENVFG